MRSRLHTAIVASLVACGVLGGCDRPFVEVRGPEIEIVEPNFSEVLSTTRIRIRVRATSFRPIERVLLQGSPLELEPESGLWTEVVDLSTGLNELVLAAFDVEDVVARDTVIAIVLAPQFSINAPALPRGIGDHAAILTRNGELLVTGGALQSDGEGLDAAYISSPAGTPFQQLSSGMLQARLGHTMTNLPDGRVLIVGGASRGIVNDVLALVNLVELFDPATREFEAVTVAADPIRSAFHTASGESGPSGFILDLFGGRGDVRYRPSPDLGIRDDIRSYIFRNDSLIAFSPSPGPTLGPPVYGHTQTATTSVQPFSPANYQIHGSQFGQGFFESISFTVDFSDPLGLIVRDAGQTIEPRIHHATVILADGLLLTMGGSNEFRKAPLGSIEVYVDRRRQFLELPLGGAGPLRRSGHTATKLPDGRIMIVGGFLTGGNSTSLSEYLSFTSN